MLWRQCFICRHNTNKSSHFGLQYAHSHSHAHTSWRWEFDRFNRQTACISTFYSICFYDFAAKESSVRARREIRCASLFQLNCTVISSHTHTHTRTRGISLPFRSDSRFHPAVCAGIIQCILRCHNRYCVSIGESTRYNLISRMPPHQTRQMFRHFCSVVSFLCIYREQCGVVYIPGIGENRADFYRVRYQANK